MSTVDVVITGMGATTPLGGDVASTWDGLIAGRNGIAINDAEWAERYDLPVAARAHRWPSSRRRCCRACSCAGWTAASRSRSSRPGRRGRTPGYEMPSEEHQPVDPDRLGVAIGTGIGGPVTLLDQDDLLESRACARSRR